MTTSLISVACVLGGMLVQPAAFAIEAARPVPAVQPQSQQAEPKPVPSAAPAPVPVKDGGTIVGQLASEADKLSTLMETAAARKFLEEAKNLPSVETRTVYRKPGSALPVTDWEKLAAEERAAYKPRPCTPEFYYYTGYGSPLVYARVVDLMSLHGEGDGSLAGKRVLDFGYGTIGHLRLMAQCGAEAHGVEIEPLFAALYSDPADLRVGTAEQAVFLHTGQWPANERLAEKVAARGPFDVITSKNTLKKGYIHPEPPSGKTVDEKQLVKLGVDDAAFLAAVREALRPGGLFIIYNICPAQSPAEDLSKPYLPMADGRSPISREQYENAGFEVVKLDEDDQMWVLGCWRALGYDRGVPAAEAAKEVFAHYTVARRRSSTR